MGGEFKGWGLQTQSRIGGGVLSVPVIMSDLITMP